MKTPTKKSTIALAIALMFLAVIATDSAWTNSRVAAAPQGQLYTISTEMSHTRAVEAAEDYCTLILLFEDSHRPGRILYPTIKITDENGEECQPIRYNPYENEMIKYNCKYGTYSIKATEKGYEEFSEDDYEVNQSRQTKAFEMTPSGSAPVVAAEVGAHE